MMPHGVFIICFHQAALLQRLSLVVFVCSPAIVDWDLG